MRKSDMKKGKGKVKETVGKITGDKEREAEGKADRMEGKTREAAEEMRRVAEKAPDAMKRRAS
ncbi:CsbD family protein [Streptomyces narbonensis]|uniref:CsbD family protein n=1 Tax=Streptomyces narbonensis TaxID=67333 RepID=A0ABV3CL86_9ACTN